MSFKSWRERRLLSQERVAQMSGLSLRTIQRLEAGHRVSYASLRALAATFKIDVDSLERDLYAMEKSTDDDFVEIPRWARLLSDKLYFGGRHPSRRTHVLIESLCIACAVVVFAASFAIAQEARAAVRTCAFLAVFCALLISLQNRTFDRYGLWAGSENTPPERPRTWRGKAVEYTIVLGVGILGLVAVGFLAV